MIKSTHDKEKVKINGVEMTMRKALLEVKVNNETMFQSVEQGCGQRNDDVFLHHHPDHEQLVMKCFTIYL